MGAKIRQFYEKCKSCPKLFASKGKKAFKGKKDFKGEKAFEGKKVKR